MRFPSSVIKTAYQVCFVKLVLFYNRLLKSTRTVHRQRKKHLNPLRPLNLLILNTTVIENLIAHNHRPPPNIYPSCTRKCPIQCHASLSLFPTTTLLYTTKKSLRSLLASKSLFDFIDHCITPFQPIKPHVVALNPLPHISHHLPYSSQSHPHCSC